MAETLTRERIADVSGQDVDLAAILSSVAEMTTLRRAPALAHVAGYGRVPGLGPRRGRDRDNRQRQLRACPRLTAGPHEQATPRDSLAAKGGLTTSNANRLTRLTHNP